MPPKRKRSAVKLERPASSSGESDSDFSEVSDTPFFRTRQCHSAVKSQSLKYSALTVDSLLCLIVGVMTRLQAVVTSLRYEDVFGAGRIMRETIRVCSGALYPLSEALDELTALENALEERLLMIQRHRARNARRASHRPQQQ
jgi:hypothetical protein